MYYWLTDKTLIAYIYSTVTFLLLSLIFKKVGKNVASFLNISNLIALIGLTINLFLVGLETVQCKFAQNDRLSNALTKGNDFYHTSNCFTFFIWTAMLAFLVQLPFLYKRYRQKVWLTVVSMLSLSIVYNLERIVILITSIHRQYQPSSWVIYYPVTDRIWTITFSIVYFVICWTIPVLVRQKGKE